MAFQFRRRARGRVRHVAGQPNQLEIRYGQHLEQRRLVGEILWYKFEAVKLRLADNTWFTVDYFVMLADGELEAHECKAGKKNKSTGATIPFFEDDARVKIKVAADIYPFRFYSAFENGRNNWQWQEI